MSDKKERILAKALELFANYGFSGVSTFRIAQAASVSEGLIFRHYGSKKGLLEAIIQDTEERVVQLFEPILAEKDAESVIRKYIELPFQIPSDNYNYWRLQFKLKWEVEYNNPKKMQPMIKRLTACFKTLEYEQAKIEAELLVTIVDAIAINILQVGIKSQKPLKVLLLKKYKI